jgi:hypothetical protein
MKRGKPDGDAAFPPKMPKAAAASSSRKLSSSSAVQVPPMPRSKASQALSAALDAGLDSEARLLLSSGSTTFSSR